MSTAATLSNVAAGVQSPASLSKVVAKVSHPHNQKQFSKSKGVSDSHFFLQENEWVAPQFHRKVHVNNRIYIEGAGIEKVKLGVCCLSRIRISLDTKD